MMSEPTPPVNETGEPTTATPNARRPRLAVRLFGLALIVFSVAAATYLLVGYVAFESGQAQRVEQETTTRNDQIARQIDLAREDLAQGSDNLALTRLDWVLAQDPANAGALALRDQVLSATAEPTPTDAPTEASPTEVSATEAPPPGDEEALPELQAIRRLAAAEQWQEALPLLLAFQQRYPDYERADSDQLLFDAYVALGLENINTSQIELGLNYFAQAEQLGELPQEALDYRVWADLYFEAVAYSGVNWGIAADYWRDLCFVAPFFQDACARLDEALIGIGDEYAYFLDWCPAVPIYQEVYNRIGGERLGNKLGQARAGCASATPVGITGTTPLTGTNPLTPTEPGG
jgi:hypothetical protein